VVGWDGGRLAMLLAVLEARCGLAFTGADVYLNVAGGLRVQEPGADLAVAAALVSAVSGVPVPPEAVVFGEVGLAGEVRPVAHTETRLKEAAKLGFTRAIVPARRGKPEAGSRPAGPKGMEIQEITRVDEVVRLFGPAAAGGRMRHG
jgi:DNA repair protein RadA/Sms